MISAIIPVYNTAPYLPALFRSLQAQTMKDLELIFVNDGSTDESGALLDRFAAEDPRIRVIHKENGGVSSARNMGLEVAEKEIDLRNQINIMGSGSSRYLSQLKIGRKGTWYYLDGTRNLNIMQQIQVDVFLFDYIVPLNPTKKRLYEKVRKILYLTKLNWDEKRLIMMVMDESKRKGRFLYKASLVLMHGVRSLMKEYGIEKLMYKMFIDETKTSGRLGIILDNPSAGGRIATWPEEDFSNLITMSYAGIPVKVPACYDRFLTDIYGDYMTPPPGDKRYRRHLDRLIVCGTIWSKIPLASYTGGHRQKAEAY